MELDEEVEVVPDEMLVVVVVPEPDPEPEPELLPVEVLVEPEAVVVDPLELLELELLLFRIPPTTPPGGEVLVVAFLASAAKASRVLPDVGL